jgi:hypothetical protein
MYEAIRATVAVERAAVVVIFGPDEQFQRAIDWSSCVPSPGAQQRSSSAASIATPDKMPR